MADVFKYCQDIRRYAVESAAVFEYLYSIEEGIERVRVDISILVDEW